MSERDRERERERQTDRERDRERDRDRDRDRHRDRHRDRDRDRERERDRDRERERECVCVYVCVLVVVIICRCVFFFCIHVHMCFRYLVEDWNGLCLNIFAYGAVQVGNTGLEEFQFPWWDHVFNKAAQSIVVEKDQEEVSLCMSLVIDLGFSQWSR